MNCAYMKLLEQSKREVLELQQIKAGWNEEAKQGKSTLFTKKHGDCNINLVKITSVVPSDIEKCKKFYFDDLQAQHESKENSEFIREIERIDDSTKIIFLKFKGKNQVSGREILAVSHVFKTNDGYLIIKSNLDDHPEAQPTKDSVRGELIISGISLSKIDNLNTQVEVYQLLDPKENISEAFVNQAILKQLEAQESAINFIKKY